MLKPASPLGRETRKNQSNIRKMQGSSFYPMIIGLATFFLLFPVFSTADDFHACHQSLDFVVASPHSTTLVDLTSFAHPGEDNVFCLACVWSSFEDATPADPLILNLSFDNFAKSSCTELTWNAHSRVSCISDRAPPIV